MHLRVHTLVITVVVLLTITGGKGVSLRPWAGEARAQVVTPDPSPPSFENQRFVIGSDNISNPAEGNPPTFATAVVDDPNAFPVASVKVRNYEGFAGDQRFWLSVRVTQQDPGVEVAPEPGYAEMGLIAPGGDAAYTVTFPESGSAQAAFEVDGGTDEAALLTVLQFALDAGFAAADLTGLGSHDQEIGLELVQVVAEQYLADLPSFVPCANAVAAVQRGMPDQQQFARDVQGCLESPVWQASVDQVLARVAERDWFQQSLDLAGAALPAVGVALKTVKAEQFVAQVWGMYQKFHPEIPGAMVGTVVFMSVDTTDQQATSTPAAIPDFSVYEVVGRAQEALQQAGTYRFQVFDLQGGRTLLGAGEVDFAQGKKYLLADGSSEEYLVGDTYYNRDSNGVWSVTQTEGFIMRVEEELMRFVRQAGASGWTVENTELVDGRQAYVLHQVRPAGQGWTLDQRLWIDAESFLPMKREARMLPPGANGEPGSTPDQITQTIYSGFGQPVDVQVPAEALAPTPEFDDADAQAAIEVVKNTPCMGASFAGATVEEFIVGYLLDPADAPSGYQETESGWTAERTAEVVGGGWEVRYTSTLSNGVTEPIQKTVVYLYNPANGRVVLSDETNVYVISDVVGC